LDILTVIACLVIALIAALLGFTSFIGGTETSTKSVPAGTVMDASRYLTMTSFPDSL
jgi:hypothetical protein